MLSERNRFMSNTDSQRSQIKALIAKGKEQGFLTYAEVNDHLPDGIVDPEQIEDIVSMINDMGITVHEEVPDADSLQMGDDISTDDDAAEAAAAALAVVDSEFGRTTDPVRMYMREMGTVELLTREGELDIAKRIEQGLMQMHAALGQYPPAIETFLEAWSRVAAGDASGRHGASRGASHPTSAIASASATASATNSPRQPSSGSAHCTGSVDATIPSEPVISIHAFARSCVAGAKRSR